MPLDIARNVSFGFTDDLVTARGGLALLAQLAKFVGLPDMLGASVRVKKRRRGCRDDQMLLSLVFSFACGCGRLAGRLAPAVVRDCVDTLGYVPVLVDGTGIEVQGRQFEKAAKGYNGERQYWLHSVFAGGAWVSGRLRPGGSDVGGGWREQLEADVAPLLRAGLPVWLRADSACYRGDLARYCRERGWDYSVSVTDARKRKPVLDKLRAMELRDDEWEPLDEDGAESATVVFHRPSGWDREEAYAVVRRTRDGDQLLMEPRHTVILVSDDRLPVQEAVRRHRGKQGRENAFCCRPDYLNGGTGISSGLDDSRSVGKSVVIRRSPATRPGAATGLRRGAGCCLL